MINKLTKIVGGTIGVCGIILGIFSYTRSSIPLLVYGCTMFIVSILTLHDVNINKKLDVIINGE